MVFAVFWSVATRVMRLPETMDALVEGMQAVLLACTVLVLAWTLGAMCKELKTADYLVLMLNDVMHPMFMPAAVFVVAALISFATGTSWGTMAILFPLVVPLVHALAPGDEALLLGAISSVLSGAVWGDHCSPISDTTILSSMGSGCDHIAHVRTQLPYALVVGAVSLLVGEIGVGLGLYPVWVALLLGVAILILVVRFMGTKPT
ncbi:MAG: Na+/H+ antiporter NhaC family protein [Polyangiales bacterium]